MKKSDVIDVQLNELSEEFATKMRRDLDGVNTRNYTLDELNDKIVESIKDFMEAKCKSSRVNESKLSEETLDLIADRLKLIKDGKRDSIDITKIINKKMKSDLREYNVQLAQNTIENDPN